MASKHDFPGRRWLSIVLRSLHLVGVVLLGAAIFGRGEYAQAGIALLFVTGLGLYAIELMRHPELWRAVAGLLTPLKLTLLAAMALYPELTAPAFWLMLVTSSVVSHAPWEFRHTAIFRTAGPNEDATE